MLVNSDDGMEDGKIASLDALLEKLVETRSAQPTIYVSAAEAALIETAAELVLEGEFEEEDVSRAFSFALERLESVAEANSDLDTVVPYLTLLTNLDGPIRQTFAAQPYKDKKDAMDSILARITALVPLSGEASITSRMIDLILRWTKHNERRRTLKGLLGTKVPENITKMMQQGITKNWWPLVYEATRHLVTRKGTTCIDIEALYLDDVQFLPNENPQAKLALFLSSPDEVTRLNSLWITQSGSHINSVFSRPTSREDVFAWTYKSVTSGSSVTTIELRRISAANGQEFKKLSVTLNEEKNAKNMKTMIRDFAGIEETPTSTPGKLRRKVSVISTPISRQPRMPVVVEEDSLDSFAYSQLGGASQANLLASQPISLSQPASPQKTQHTDGDRQSAAPTKSGSKALPAATKPAASVRVPRERSKKAVAADSAPDAARRSKEPAAAKPSQKVNCDVEAPVEYKKVPRSDAFDYKDTTQGAGSEKKDAPKTRYSRERSQKTAEKTPPRSPVSKGSLHRGNGRRGARTKARLQNANRAIPATSVEGTRKQSKRTDKNHLLNAQAARKMTAEKSNGKGNFRRRSFVVDRPHEERMPSNDRATTSSRRRTARKLVVPAISDLDDDHPIDETPFDQVVNKSSPSRSRYHKRRVDTASTNSDSSSPRNEDITAAVPRKRRRAEAKEDYGALGKARVKERAADSFQVRGDRLDHDDEDEEIANLEAMCTSMWLHGHQETFTTKQHRESLTTSTKVLNSALEKPIQKVQASLKAVTAEAEEMLVRCSEVHTDLHDVGQWILELREKVSSLETHTKKSFSKFKEINRGVTALVEAIEPAHTKALSQQLKTMKEIDHQRRRKALQRFTSQLY